MKDGNNIKLQIFAKNRWFGCYSDYNFEVGILPSVGINLSLKNPGGIGNPSSFIRFWYKFYYLSWLLFILFLPKLSEIFFIKRFIMTLVILGLFSDCLQWIFTEIMVKKWASSFRYISLRSTTWIFSTFWFWSCCYV